MTLLRVHQGERRAFAVTLRSRDGQFFDLTGYQVQFRGALGDVVVFDKELGAGVEVVDPQAGRVVVQLEPEDLAGAGRYTTELRISSDKQILTVIQTPMVVEESLYGEE